MSNEHDKPITDEQDEQPEKSPETKKQLALRLTKKALGYFKTASVVLASVVSFAEAIDSKKN